MSQDKEREALIAFLQGAAPLDGVWFGERHPTEKGAFWWRKRLAALASQQAVKGEPVAWMYRVFSTVHFHEKRLDHYYNDGKDYIKGEPLYASPPSREPLTELLIEAEFGSDSNESYPDFLAGVRFAERAHGIHSREGENKS